MNLLKWLKTSARELSKKKIRKSQKTEKSTIMWNNMIYHHHCCNFEGRSHIYICLPHLIAACWSAWLCATWLSSLLFSRLLFWTSALWSNFQLKIFNILHTVIFIISLSAICHCHFIGTLNPKSSSQLHSCWAISHGTNENLPHHAPIS